MPVALTGGPYFAQNYVAASEIILIETLADILTNAGWTLIEKVGAMATSIPVDQPTNGTSVYIDGTTFVFKDTPTGIYDIQIGASLGATLENFADAVNEDSPTCNGFYDPATGVVKVQCVVGGTFGNGKAISGWQAWNNSAVGYSTPTNQLWLGGYKFQTNFPGGGSLQPSVLPAIPCNVYFFQDNGFGWSWFTDGWGWPATTAKIQFMSVDETKKGLLHDITAGPGAHLRVLASPVQFFMFRTDRVIDPAGGVVCGGSFFTNYDPASPPKNAWYSMGDSFGSPFTSSGTLTTNFSNLSQFNGAQEMCFDDVYNGGNASDKAFPQVTLRMNPGRDTLAAGGPYRAWGGDPIVSEPFLIAGDTVYSPTKFRGQLYDALIVAKQFPQRFDGLALAKQYPWSNGAVLPDGTPRNRLSADFDLAKWENITDNNPDGGLFIVKDKEFAPATGSVNYVYEGKA